jgi:deferrochelatase/peroxidase EfeB
VDWRWFLLGESNSDIPSKPSSSKAATFFAGSSYVAMRVLGQDVVGFWKFCQEQAELLSSTARFGECRTPSATWVAAKMVGRWPDGTPLVHTPDEPLTVPSNRYANDFLYAAEDPAGLRCPFAAHIRVCNPRDQALFPVHGTRPPPLIRRGVPFGTLATQPITGPSRDTDEERGLIGLFACSSLLRQFETVQRWINTHDFSPVFKSADAGRFRSRDPLVGNRAAPPAEGPWARLDNHRVPKSAMSAIQLGPLQQFVTTRLGLYLLLPSLRTLSKLGLIAKT